MFFDVGLSSSSRDVLPPGDTCVVPPVTHYRQSWGSKDPDLPSVDPSGNRVSVFRTGSSDQTDLFRVKLLCSSRVGGCGDGVVWDVFIRGLEHPGPHG